MIGIPIHTDTLADEAIAKIVNQSRRQDCGIASDQALVESNLVHLRRSTGQERRVARTVIAIFVGQGSGKREAMLAVGGNVVVKFGNIPVPMRRGRVSEPKASGVQEISCRLVVRQRILTHVLQHRGVGPGL